MSKVIVEELVEGVWTESYVCLQKSCRQAKKDMIKFKELKPSDPRKRVRRG